MRGAVPGLPSRYPLGRSLPALYQDDSFTQRFLAGLDEVLAPVLTVLDCVDAHIDPRTAPLDLVRWVGSWLGVDVDPAWDGDKQRAVVRAAARVHARRGTAAALEEWLWLVHGMSAQVRESGGVSVSESPGGALPGEPEPAVHVRLKAATPQQVEAVRPLLRGWCPAHALLTVESDA